MSSASRRVRRQLAAYDRGAQLDYDDQEELAVKVRYGVGGVRELIEALIASAPAELTERPPIRERAYPPGPPAGSEAARRAAIARLGRGHQLGRTWRR